MNAVKYASLMALAFTGAANARLMVEDTNANAHAITGGHNMPAVGLSSEVDDLSVATIAKLGDADFVLTKDSKFIAKPIYTVPKFTATEVIDGHHDEMAPAPEEGDEDFFEECEGACAEAEAN